MLCLGQGQPLGTVSNKTVLVPIFTFCSHAISRIPVVFAKTAKNARALLQLWDEGTITMSQDGAIRSQIQTFIFEKFPVARKRRVADDTRLLESGVVDSLGILDVVAFLERTFRIKIHDEELLPENFGSIHDLSVFVSRKTANLAVPAV